MARGKKSRSRRQSRPQNQGGNNSSDDGDGNGYLMIGGIRINVTPQGNVAGMANKSNRRAQPRQQQQHSFSNSDSDDDESPLEAGEMDSDDMLDYLQNIGATAAAAGDESDEEEDENAVFGNTAAGRRHHFEMLRRFGGVEIGDEGAPEDVIGRFYDEDEDSESPEEEEDDSSFESSSSEDDDESANSLSSFSTDKEEEENEEDDALKREEDMMDGEGVLTIAELEQLPTAIRYPVAVRPTAVLVSGEKQGNGPGGGGSKTKNKRGKNSKKKGGNSGKFAPGEKARLRREKINARRAERAVVRGFDLAGINKELENFVQKEHDMYAFPPMPKHECRQVQKLAALYGCKAGAQGSGKKRSVMVVMTERTAMPEGAALLEIGRLLTAHTATELGRGASGRDATPTIPGLWIGSNSTAASGSAGGGKRRGSNGGGGDFVETGKSRWADFRKKGPRSIKSTARKRHERAVLEDDANGGFVAARRKHLRPVYFVSRGTINPDDDIFELYEPGEEEEENSSDGIEEEDAGPSILPVFEDLKGGSTSSGGEEDEDDIEDEEEVIDDAHFRPSMLGIGHPDDNRVNESGSVITKKKKEEKEKTPKYNTETVASSSGGVVGNLLSYSSRGADAAEGITNSGRLLGLGMALGIGAQVFSAADEELTATERATADLSPLEPMLSKTAQKKLAEQKKRAALPVNGGGFHSQTPSLVTKEGRRGSSKKKSAAVYSSSPATRTATAAAAAPGVPVSGEYGDFEAHTTGIGSKLLAKWGFAGVGSGLGRGGTGISEPLQVKMRAKGLGLGAER